MAIKRVTYTKPTGAKVTSISQALSSDPDWAEIRNMSLAELKAWWTSLPSTRKAEIAKLILQVLWLVLAKLNDIEDRLG